jgi:hypothetical protein
VKLVLTVLVVCIFWTILFSLSAFSSEFYKTVVRGILFGLSDSDWGPVSDCCEHSSESLGFNKRQGI